MIVLFWPFRRLLCVHFQYIVKSVRARKNLNRFTITLCGRVLQRKEVDKNKSGNFIVSPN